MDKRKAHNSAHSHTMILMSFCHLRVNGTNGNTSLCSGLLVWGIFSPTPAKSTPHEVPDEDDISFLDDTSVLAARFADLDLDSDIEEDLDAAMAAAGTSVDLPPVSNPKPSAPITLDAALPDGRLREAPRIDVASAALADLREMYAYTRVQLD
ncbi:hypothetical protein R3P38DRAFT_3193480 [Favolaschia claudopus]|uniref:Uncharacterized protein n=1 Tax=Favolaschia claudopus TaxID=2862362 RepID=A0AAW0BIM6_9AGAR